jgi:nucleotide-binding universal stress UspA family protein
MTKTMKTILGHHESSPRWTDIRTVQIVESAGQPDSPEQWRNRRQLKLQNILVPVDFTTSSVKAIEFARGLAAPFGSTVCLLHVVEKVCFMAGVEDVPLWKSEQEVSSESRVWIAELAEQHLGPAVPVDIQIVSGHAASEIIGAARANHSGLIILTTHGLHRWRHLLRGSTAQKVMRDAPCPALLLQCPKPAGLEREADVSAPATCSSNDALRMSGWRRKAARTQQPALHH